MTAAVTVAQSGAPGVSLGFKNRIINGGMTIDQRNGGASVTPANNQYMVDRFVYGASQASKFTAQQDTIAPTGFKNSLKMTVASAVTVGASDYFVVNQYIEGLNCADLGFGAAGAASVTLSFWVRSSLTGTFGIALFNSGASRSYPFSYTINLANTWEQKSITIPGDITGTWLTTNGSGIGIGFSLGCGSTYTGTANTWAAANYAQPTGSASIVGTGGATWYITGVQLEVGTAATQFEFRDYGRELIMCQRYYQKFVAGQAYTAFASGFCQSSTGVAAVLKYITSMRASPTISQANTGINNPSEIALSSIGTCYLGTDSAFVSLAVAGGLTAGTGVLWNANNNTAAYVDLTAEL